jgi:hypothetical protein
LITAWATNELELRIDDGTPVKEIDCTTLVNRETTITGVESTIIDKLPSNILRGPRTLITEVPGAYPTRFDEDEFRKLATLLFELIKSDAMRDVTSTVKSEEAFDRNVPATRMGVDW